jgi:hypothetical protein
MAAAGAAAAGGAGGAGGGAGVAGGAGGADAAGGIGRGGSRPSSDSRPQRSNDRSRRDESEGDESQEQERNKRRLKLLLLLLLVLFLFAVFTFCVVLVVVFQASQSQASPQSANGYPTGSGVPPVYWPVYVAAATQYHVNPYLLASIHEQETGFSTATSTKSGFNSNGCCAGPMQFNVKAGTWKAYQYAFRPISEQRSAEHYPSDRRDLPSCRSVPVDTGCVYDDFDAIAGAAEKLHRDGADTSLYSKGTRDAVCSYIGSCSEVESCSGDENQYCEVIPRARKWEQLGVASTPAVAPGSRARLLPNGLAAAPADAPLAVRQMIAAANEISDKPYEEVHYPTHINNPTYDCSSSTSHVLWAGGKFGVAPWCSAEFAHYGIPGAGSWVTVHARGPCGAGGHVWMEIAGLRFDTSPREDSGPNAAESGPRWRTPRHDLNEFISRHPEGL